MLKVGLTGGIGSGKSTIASIFETLGIPVYYADAAAKELMNTDPALIENILKQFGVGAYSEGRLNRKFIAEIVFNDPAKLQLLNSLTHPATIKAAQDWMQQQQTSYVIKEAALLFESGSNIGLDFVIGVSAPAETRIQRVIDRDGLNREQVMQRMSRQLDEESKLSQCDFLIINDETEPVIPQVLELHNKLMDLARK